MSPARVTVLIADDHPIVAEGLKALLRQSFEVVGEVSDGRLVVDTVRKHSPDVLLLDLSMPHRGGLDLLPELSRTFPKLKILVVTMHVDRTLVDIALDSGAAGFLPKEASATELTSAINQVMQGEKYISNRVPKKSYRAGEALLDPALDRLTPRQLQILRMVGDGRTSIEIAESLGLSPRTIEFHRSSIRKALGVTSESAMLRFAVMLRSEGKPE